jgi:N utilization substance protein B
VTLLDERLADRESRAGNNPYTADLVRGVVGRWNDINGPSPTTARAGRSTGCRPSTGHPASGRVGDPLERRDPRRRGDLEAVALATDLSTDESPAFVNGLLGRLAEVKATIV